MTTFEITIIVLLLAIVLLLMWLIVLTRNNYRLNQTKELKRQQQVESLLSHLKTMRERSILLLAISDRLEIHSDNCNKRLAELTDTVNKMHRNLCVEIADKMVNKMYPINEGESLDAPFEPDYKLKKDIENKLNGFAAAVLDAKCCPQEILDIWTERICESAHKFIKQFKIDWDKLSKEQQDEFLKRLIMPNYDSPFQPIYTPCYTPDGICINPHRDCINCPKRGTGGFWTTNTSIKAKDAPLQEWFNDNKED
jgi:hypothetical protein